MRKPFKNDPFSLIWEAFKNLYPDKECECFWETQIRDNAEGHTCYGLTDFGEDGSVVVFVSATLQVLDAVEILAHELAHVAVGVEYDHGEEWERAFDRIFKEYNRLGDAMFGERKDND